jgi:hypothetical protein
MEYEFLPATEMRINEILERLERIEKMLQRLTGSDYSGKFIPKQNTEQWLDPYSTAGNWHGSKGE